MPKDKLTDYDSTAANNLDVGGISVAEGMLPSGVNNAIREQMSHLADFAAGTSGVDVLKLQDDTDTNSIKLQAPSSVTTTTTFTLPDGDGASGQTMITDGAGTLSWAAPYGNRNLIINGACVIDQRNGGSSITPTDGQFSADRWQANVAQSSKLTIQQSTTAPTGFSNSLLVTSSSAYSVTSSDYFYIRQNIEGYNFAHLEFGSANAKTFTLSFWVRSSLTGTFGGAVNNGAGNRSYAFTYTISSADTWEYKTITVTGDTSGTWLTTNGKGLSLDIGLGVGSTYSGTAGSWAGSLYLSATGATSVVGTSGATFYITGVQLEVGEQATPFEHRSYGDELARCQRYYELIGYALGRAVSSSQAEVNSAFKVDKRANPTITLKNGTSAIAEFLRAAANVTSLDSTYNSQTTHCGNRVTSSDTGMNNAEMVSIIRPDTFAVDAEL